ncbi:unnamed protein product [Prorocentrum cordatum]|uniref:Uncharacterized protein n=1 Tax=Prorocentrum cordatum TaxID=2364126 RepID=A0ABN9QXK4_9DINO|nr:unnamed protein product [Polarella glacialis]
MAQVIEDLRSQIEQQSQDSREQQRLIENLHSEIGRLRRTNAELESEVDWAHMDALELHYREVERSRGCSWGETQPVPELSQFAAPKLRIDKVEHPIRPAVFQAFLTPPCSSRVHVQDESGRGLSCSATSTRDFCH